MMNDNKPSMIRTVFGMMISPGATLKTALNDLPWFFSLLVSTLAFLLFFAQTGLDLYKTGQQGLGFVLLCAGAGAVYGITVIPLLGMIIWLVLKAAKCEKGAKWAVTSFCMGYSGTLIYGIIGLIFSLALGWRTSVAFGVTGVLWATGPIIAAIREMAAGKSALGILLSTFAGAVVLFSWSLFGNL